MSNRHLETGFDRFRLLVHAAELFVPLNLLFGQMLDLNTVEDVPVL